MRRRPWKLRHASSSEIICVINIFVPADLLQLQKPGLYPSRAVTTSVQTPSPVHGIRERQHARAILANDKESRFGRMNIYFCFIHVAFLICAAASAESEQVLVDDKLLEGGSNPGRRTGTLYCRVGIGFHLQIHPDGRVNGSHAPDHLSKFLPMAWIFSHRVC